MEMEYDYLIVGAGLFGAIFAREASLRGHKCLVIDKRSHIGGNLYCEKVNDINVHTYGAHIFHTSNKEVWEYMNQFVEFNHYVNSPIANYKGKLYNLPFNMNTFYQLWGVTTPADAEKRIQEQTKKITNEPQNLEEQAISLVGEDIYEILIKGYTEKQWGRPVQELPSFIIKRLPLRFTFNNNYFNDTYQGIPKGGYNVIFSKCFQNCDVLLNTDFFQHQELKAKAKKIIFTGAIDQYYNYCYGKLEYRSLNFEHEILNIPNYQGNAVINYTDEETPFTRIIEHKHFEFGQQSTTVVTKEFSVNWEEGLEQFYPINDEINNEIFSKYKELANQEENVLFGGRLGDYKYYDMHHIVENCLRLFT